MTDAAAFVSPLIYIRKTDAFLLCDMLNLHFIIVKSLLPDIFPASLAILNSATTATGGKTQERGTATADTRTRVRGCR